MSAVVEKRILDELRILRELVERIEALLEERLIGVEEPLSDEVRVVEEYEVEKRRGKVELVRLEDVVGGSGA